MTEEKIKELYKEYQTPFNVIQHCKKVAYVAEKIADEYIKKGADLDVNNLKYACLLHDVLRVIDFHTGENYLSIQKKLKQKYPGMDHSQAAYSLFIEMGEPVIAEIIKKHDFEAIIIMENNPFTLEEKIMTYSDKRVLHEDIVSLEERFEDGKKRYNPNNENEEYQQKIYEAYFRLEKELFDGLPISPEDI